MAVLELRGVEDCTVETEAPGSIVVRVRVIDAAHAYIGRPLTRELSNDIAIDNRIAQAAIRDRVEEWTPAGMRVRVAVSMV